ncbi:uncharacterized protein LOC128995818 [Macrosteles quadrilineatus]|uniref:uncharacterized protein LOC128995818 n=1 Tax=Macrosteles quadrilineatus TaxID=74068 RepID=UPI0023E297A5|nr:uncharacterized protein LOC128995818 [Macrosteles quadrilineatus]
MTAQKDGAPHYEDGDSLPATVEDGGPEPLQPPADRLPGIRSPLLLMVQTLGLMLSILPAILYSVLRKIVPPAGKSLKDKVVLVTGAGRGLGEGLAMRFAKEGAKVAVVDVFPQSAQETASDIQENGGIARAYVANVAKVEDIQRLRREVTEDLGPVDILVNNAGLMYGNTVTDMPDTDLRAVVEVNLLSHFWMAKEFLPSMKDRNFGHFVAICPLSALSNLVREFLPSMKDRNSGHIVAICSLSALSNMAKEFLPSMKDRNSGHIVAVCSLSALSNMAKEFLPSMMDRNSGHIVAVCPLSALSNMAKEFLSSMMDRNCGHIVAVCSLSALSNMAKEFLPSMKDRNSGHIVAVCSLSALSNMAKEFLPSMMDRNSGHIVAVCSLSALSNMAKEFLSSMMDRNCGHIVAVCSLSALSNMAKEFLPSMKDRNSGHIVAVCSLSALSNMAKEFLPSMMDRNSGHIVAVCSLSALSNMAKEFLPSMKDRNSGHIVAICSLSALSNMAKEFLSSMMDRNCGHIVAVCSLSALSNMAKEFLPSMKDRNSGHIVAICSLSALSAPANAAAYSCCKSGVKGFMESLRAELNSQSNNDIKVTTVLPYFINTSASYVEFFDLRIPPVSIEEAVEATVEGIKREEVVFTIPRDMYFSVHLFQLFPQYIIDKFKEIFYFRVAIPPEERRKKEPTQHIISQLSSK